MAAKQVHECSTHRVTLCPEVKMLVRIKMAEMGLTKSSINYSMVLNQITEEWAEMKNKKVA